MRPDSLGEHAAALAAVTSLAPGILALAGAVYVWPGNRRNRWVWVALLAVLLYWVSVMAYVLTETL
jgi:hypothetical protein